MLIRRSTTQGELTLALPRRLFSPKLSFKITLPYLILALTAALVSTYFIARIQALSVADIFSRQFTESRIRIADSVVRTENEQLTNARTLSRITDLATAVQANDQGKVQKLIEPYAVGQGVDRVIVLNGKGQVLFSVNAENIQERTYAINPAVASWPLVTKVLHGTFDTFGDKYAAVMDDDSESILYTSAPIHADTQLVGVVLVGTPTQKLVERWRAATLVDVTIYAANGRPISTSFGRDTLDTKGEEPLAPLDTDVFATLQQKPAQQQVAQRELTLGSRNYSEVISPLMLRYAAAPQFIGVALSNSGPTNLLAQTESILLAIFTVGIVAVILIGMALSQRITRPITALVRAAEGITAGNLNHELPVTTRDEIGALTASFNTMASGLRERERMYDILGRFVSPTVAQLVLNRPLALSGENKTLSILFTDLRDFTTLTEQEEPSVVIDGLNAYFQIVVEAAERHGGVVNKFGGDSTLVLFGLTDDQADVKHSTTAAVEAALAICDGLHKLNLQRKTAQLPLLAAGIGVNTGPVIAGLIGTEQRMEYTVIGDTVNLSARIQALNRELGSDILISSATYESLECPAELDIVDYGMQRIKGKRDEVRVYGVMGWRQTDDATQILIGEEDLS